MSDSKHNVRKKHMKTITNINYATVAIAFAWFAFSPEVRAVDPPPDGGYPNDNTAEGTDALFSLTTGDGNTANGANALFNNTYGRLNTATGAFALQRNIYGAENTATGVEALANNNAARDGFLDGIGGVDQA
jgi:hypothetical protein